MVEEKISFKEVVKERKSVRRFSEKAPSLPLIKNIIELATYAPTSCNQQLWNFVVVTKKEIKDKLIQQAASSTIIARAPVVVVITYDNWNYKECIQNSSLAVGNLLLAATYFGLGSLPMNSFGNERIIKKILNIPPNQTICCFVLLGYPEEGKGIEPNVPRRPVEEVLHFETFSNPCRKAGTKGYDPKRWSVHDMIDHQKYYCRKTSLGKEMDLMHPLEREIVHQELKSLRGSILDLFSYDGSYLREFPAGTVITTTDLVPETSMYSEYAANLTAPGRKIITRIIDLKQRQINTSDKFDCSTLIYKLERFSPSLQHQILKTAHKYAEKEGKLIIIARKSNIWYNSFYYAIQKLFGDDVRKTGIYSFFGGYKPLNISDTIRMLRRSGWNKVKIKTYFTIPPFLDQAAQMYFQYRKSGGTTYLHRHRIDNFITRSINKIINWQSKLSHHTCIGSLIVITAKKMQTKRQE